MAEWASPKAWRTGFLSGLSRDGWLLFVTCAVRSFAYGFLSVMLGLFLATIGLDTVAIGIVFTAALAGGAVMTVFLTTVADQYGRRRVLMVGAALMALAGTVFALTDNLILLTIAAVLGTISPSGKEVGPFLSIEQAMLPQTTGSDRRTNIFAAYNLVGSLAGALGALAVGLPSVLGMAPLAGYRILIWGYVFAALVMLVLFVGLSPALEVAAVKSASSRQRYGVHRSRGAVARLAALFAIDAFAGGFVVQSLIAYWFYLRYGVDTRVLGSIFFGTNFLSALSFLLAVPIARRIGLLNTMVFTHLPSNLLLLLVPLMPNLELAVGMFLARHLLSQLDVPTRQSYTMAIVDPDERSAAAGIMSVARTGAAAIAPAFTGWMLAVPALGLPFLFAGGLKIIYDIAIFALFRHVRPPEEIVEPPRKSRPSSS